MTIVVIDTTVLSNFAHIQQPRLLQAAFNEPITVQTVMDELSVGMQSGRIPTVDWDWLAIIELATTEQTLADQLRQGLGRGESECIAIAQSRHWMVLTDDRDARRAARDVGVNVSGTLGALMNLVRGHTLLMAEADAFLATMKQRGYRCPVSSLSEIDSD